MSHSTLKLSMLLLAACLCLLASCQAFTKVKKEISEAQAVLERMANNLAVRADDEAQGKLRTVQSMLKCGGNLTEANCNADHLKQLDQLMVDCKEFKFDFRPYMAHHYGKQLDLCWPIFTGQLKAALETIPQRVLDSVQALKVALAAGPSQQWLRPHDFPSEENSPVFKGRLIEYLRKRQINPTLAPSKEAFKKHFSDHFEGFCREFLEKIFPITNAMNLEHIPATTVAPLNRFTTEWRLKALVCNRVLNPSEGDLAELLFLERNQYSRWGKVPDRKA